MEAFTTEDPSGAGTAGTTRTDAASIFSGSSCTTTVATPTVCSGAPTSAAAGTATLGTWDPEPSGTVRAIADGQSVMSTTTGPALSSTTVQTDAPVYLGGDFTTLGTGVNQVNANHAGEFGISGGAANATSTSGATAVSSPSTVWNPSLGGPAPNVTVRAIAIDSGGNIDLGGKLASVTIGTSAQTVRHRVVSLTPSGTSAPTVNAFDPNAGNTVDALVGSGTNLLVGGQFLVLGGTTYNNVAEMVSATGLPTAWDPGTNGSVQAVTVNGSDVYVGGVFTSAAGSPITNLAGD